MIAKVSLSMEPDSPMGATKIAKMAKAAAAPPPPKTTIKQDSSWRDPNASGPSPAASSTDPTQEMLTRIVDEFRNKPKPTTVPASDEEYYDYSYSSGGEENEEAKSGAQPAPPPTMFPPPQMRPPSTPPPQTKVKVEQPDA